MDVELNSWASRTKPTLAKATCCMILEAAGGKVYALLRIYTAERIAAGGFNEQMFF